MLLHASFLFAADDPSVVAWWSMDDDQSRSVMDSVSGCRDQLIGRGRRVNGVRHLALCLDGFTTRVTLRGTDLIVWIEAQRTATCQIELSYGESDH
jgi:hypothetical protein